MLEVNRPANLIGGGVLGHVETTLSQPQSLMPCLYGHHATPSMLLWLLLGLFFLIEPRGPPTSLGRMFATSPGNLTTRVWHTLQPIDTPDKGLTNRAALVLSNAENDARGVTLALGLT